MRSVLGAMAALALCAAPAMASAQLYAAPNPGLKDLSPASAPAALPAPSRIDDASLDCMTAAIAYEAANQPIEGQQAVGQVILNRVHNFRFPKTVCSVVFAGAERRTGCQFSFTCDGSMRRRLSLRTLDTARSVALTVLSGLAPDRVGGATHYHADYVYPYWAPSGTRSAKLGAHIFYRMPGDGSVVVPGEGMMAQDDTAVSLARLALRGAAPVATPRRPIASMTAAAARPMFAPWGLPMAAARQR